MNNFAYRILGEPKAGNVLIVGDHASNRVPDGINLGLKSSLLDRHIAWDIGVAPVAERIVRQAGFAVILGNVSRLVVDLNRYADEAAVIPEHSDGIEIPANRLDERTRADRLGAFYDPYHEQLARILTEHRPALILSLHSFTPFLESRPAEKRPWEICVLYNEQEAASKLAVEFLEGQRLEVGDQLPYSGKLLNATMNRHAETNNIPYVGIEMRQDMVLTEAGQARFAQILTDMCQFVSEKLGLQIQNS